MLNNTTIKSIILTSVLSIILTFIGSGNIYSFIFFFIVLLLPAILIIISFDMKKVKPVKKSNKLEPKNKE